MASVALTDCNDGTFEQDNFLSQEDWSLVGQSSIDFNSLMENTTQHWENDIITNENDTSISDIFTNIMNNNDKYLPESDDLKKSENFMEEVLRGINEDNVTQKAFRRLSSHSSSSAYSSHSSTPPSSQNDFDIKATVCSENLIDMGFVSDVSSENSPGPLTMAASETSSDINDSTQESNSQCSNYTKFDSLDDEDLAKAVQAACQETNRLLMMHKEKPIQFDVDNIASSATVQPSVDLKSLCDTTILSSTSTNSSSTKSALKLTRNQVILNKSNVGTKRKSQNIKSCTSNKVTALSTKNENVPFFRTAPLNNTSVANNSIQIMTSCSSVSSHSSQVTNTPLKIIVKQEPQPTYFINNPISTPTNIGITLGSPNATIIKTDQSSNPQTIVIQPVNSHISQQPIDLSNIQPGQPLIVSQSDIARLSAQGVIKFPNSQPEKTKAWPISNSEKKTQEPIPNTNVSTSTASTGKFAVDVKKKPIIPNEINSDLAVLSGNSVIVSNSNGAQLGELNIKALKRQQRMIKNRESACQSRQKRKEYLQTLESKAFECAADNKKLMDENSRLKKEIKRLKEENNGLKNLLIATHNKSNKKSAGLLILALFIGINLFPINSFLWSKSRNINDISENTILSSETHSFGRHLLSISETENNTDLKVSSKWDSKDLSTEIIAREGYWMDDFIRNYKDKHLIHLIELLQNSPNPIQRMLRRKLKEELGLRVPLPKGRRISYVPDDNEENLKVSSLSQNEYNVVKQPNTNPIMCPHSKLLHNETEVTEVSNTLTQWAKRHTVDQRKKAVEKTSKHKPKVNTKSPQSRYKQEISERNGIALYEKADKKFDDFLEAINRKNDTFYVISLGRDHVLFPATAHNSSSRTKMTLVMPAITKNSSQSNLVEYETLIEIDCEVVTTRMFKLKQSAIPDVLFENVKTKSDYGFLKAKYNVKETQKRETGNTTESFSGGSDDGATIVVEP